MSDDGRSALAVIAFIGNVFSPYYFRARAAGRADPRNFCAINVALYGHRDAHWSLTERGRDALRVTERDFSAGPSSLSWSDAGLQIDVAEITFPRPRRLRGRIRLHPSSTCDHSVALDSAGAHIWSPIAPNGRVEVDFGNPRCRWSGSGYFDSNTGSEPIENAFSTWTWSRAPRQGATVVVYDVERRHGGRFGFTKLFKADGGTEEIAAPGIAPLATTRWGLGQYTRSDAPGARILRRLEDTPFYARSVIQTTLHGERERAIHETLSLDRFRRAWVRTLLPFRMPRVR